MRRFEMESEILAVEGDTGVARIEVRYGEPKPQIYRDLWVVTLDAEGRCTAFEEWPFWPPGSGGSYAGMNTREAAEALAEAAGDGVPQLWLGVLGEDRDHVSLRSTRCSTSAAPRVERAPRRLAAVRSARSSSRSTTRPRSRARPPGPEIG